MPTRVNLNIDGHELAAELNDSETSKALLGKLPLKLRMNRWGEEYYGDIGAKLKVKPDPDEREDVAVGELAFWIPGNALCIFFGPTPASTGSEPRAASAVNPVGKVTGDLGILKKLGSGVSVEITQGA